MQFHTIVLSEALIDYRDVFMASRNLAARTRLEYVRDQEGLIAFLESKCAVSDPTKVERKHLEAYLAELDRRGFTGNTRRRKVASIRSFFTFLEDFGIAPLNPAPQADPP